MLGSISLFVTIDGQRFNSEFYVLKTLSVPILLGLPFLKQHRASINFDKNNCISLSLHKTALLKEDLLLPAYHECLCVCYVSQSDNDNILNVTGECSPLPSNYDNGLLIAHTAVTMSDNHVPVRVFNSTNVPKRV